MADGTVGGSVDRTIPLRTERIAAFDYLRSFGILLVLLHHAILAYVTWGFLNPEDPTATFSPIVDGAKWVGFDLIVGLNDTFFMPLLFFVSGLFVWRSLERKGAARYLLGRLTRLGIPFLIGVVVLVPLAYYPTVLEIGLVYGVSQSFGEFWIDFARRGFGPPGPLWFVWLLLAFDCLAALSYLVFRRASGKSKRRSTGRGEGRYCVLRWPGPLLGSDRRPSANQGSSEDHLARRQPCALGLARLRIALLSGLKRQSPSLRGAFHTCK